MDLLAADIYELTDMRDRKNRGDFFTLTILRGSEEIILEGQFPEPEKFQVFNYDLPSGAVKAKYYANQFHINTSRVKQIALFIHPEMVNLQIPVSVYVNGEKKIEDLISIDRDFMLDNFRENLDRKTIWINKIIIDI